VVLGTLVLQGMTLRPLIGALKLEDDGEVDRGEELLRLLRRKYEARLRRAEADGSVSARGGDDGMPGFAAAYRRAQEEERRALSELRASGVIGDDAFHRVEEELDWAEVNAEAMARGE
jgi:monovalent cation/hydrogen antiporter